MGWARGRSLRQQVSLPAAVPALRGPSWPQRIRLGPRPVLCTLGHQGRGRLVPQPPPSTPPAAGRLRLSLGSDEPPPPGRSGSPTRPGPGLPQNPGPRGQTGTGIPQEIPGSFRETQARFSSPNPHRGLRKPQRRGPPSSTLPKSKSALRPRRTVTSRPRDSRGRTAVLRHQGPQGLFLLADVLALKFLPRSGVFLASVFRKFALSILRGNLPCPNRS